MKQSNFCFKATQQVPNYFYNNMQPINTLLQIYQISSRKRYLNNVF